MRFSQLKIDIIHVPPSKYPHASATDNSDGRPLGIAELFERVKRFKSTEEHISK